ncbi:PREDICTED: probable UDP-3-O-acylglucosamine N-acyltransferase 2, mitochondrial [Tarenaya hassleriana]|uniref:probable UDP-3-O-acylglucosamine N-acyltransferase 2, mitochondrial n=1 Tax=Tarenaya hassleriana TaxID=28532 RepID=UPI00053C4BCE|nr:PREDICTED: probable UDP-3-O-acylglucosamine N-acyltransferase 2, mitochondrial [Tarenaya hassleriana]XP_010538675.1 PREDICTED: probable UDP-3-O-acylglucosamine N-acyltransferase 2, mitochondrial [Tarenaya hassleriana]XP_010538676.1 PREDICTED: probable UDP-3-O-acylglucosamine N-acyltransferase 2, mitochondrial [Tarenaya hassleriana]
MAMAVTLRRLVSASVRNSLHNVLLSKPLIGRQPCLPLICRNLSACSDHQSGSEAVNVSQSIGTSGSVVNEEFLRWRNGGGTCHRSALVDPTALVEIGAIVHENAVLGADVHVGTGTVIGPSVKIGRSTKIGYNVSVSNCSIGDLCVVHNGVCIGQDGFGFYVDEKGNMVKKPQTLNVRIGNHVEIGANTCIDRGSWRDTVIGDDTKIDNLVQIGHNVIIGKSCLLCGQVGIAGSVKIGDYVTLGGRVAVRDHVSIVSKVRLAANSCVTRNITEPGDFGGFPAVPIHQWRRQIVKAQISNGRKL